MKLVLLASHAIPVLASCLVKYFQIQFGRIDDIGRQGLGVLTRLKLSFRSDSMCVLTLQQAMLCQPQKVDHGTYFESLIEIATFVVESLLMNTLHRKNTYIIQPMEYQVSSQFFNASR